MWTEDYRDISFVGITPFTAASIWVGDPTNQSAVPTGSCGDVFRNFTTSLMDAKALPVQEFDFVDYPAYEWYEDMERHVYSQGTYNAMVEAERKAAEEAERKRRAAAAAAKKKAQSSQKKSSN